MISFNYILAVLGVLQCGAWAFPVDRTSAATATLLAKLPRGRRALSNDDGDDDGDDDDGDHSETAMFTIVNQHTSAVKLVLTRGCDGTPGGNGWAPFPSMIDSAGAEYDEESMTGLDGTGGNCANPEGELHLDLGELGADDSLDIVVPVGWHGKLSLARAECELTGTNETLLEGSFDYQNNGYGEENLMLDFDVSFVLQLGPARDE
ncbi:hypothetical protein LQW54_001629 [Pestalotiopsis sp. IQ-011]